MSDVTRFPVSGFSFSANPLESTAPYSTVESAPALAKRCLILCQAETLLSSMLLTFERGFAWTLTRGPFICALSCLRSFRCAAVAADATEAACSELGLWSQALASLKPASSELAAWRVRASSTTHLCTDAAVWTKSETCTRLSIAPQGEREPALEEEGGRLRRRTALPCALDVLGVAGVLPSLLSPGLPERLTRRLCGDPAVCQRCPISGVAVPACRPRAAGGASRSRLAGHACAEMAGRCSVSVTSGVQRRPRAFSSLFASLFASPREDGRADGIGGRAGKS